MLKTIFKLIGIIAAFLMTCIPNAEYFMYCKPLQGFVWATACASLCLACIFVSVKLSKEN